MFDGSQWHDVDAFLNGLFWVHTRRRVAHHVPNGPSRPFLCASNRVPGQTIRSSNSVEHPLGLESILNHPFLPNKLIMDVGHARLDSLGIFAASTFRLGGALGYDRNATHS